VKLAFKVYRDHCDVFEVHLEDKDESFDGLMLGEGDSEAEAFADAEDKLNALAAELRQARQKSEKKHRKANP
jgi:hypothetical protein